MVLLERICVLLNMLHGVWRLEVSRLRQAISHSRKRIRRGITDAFLWCPQDFSMYISDIHSMSKI